MAQNGWSVEQHAEKAAWKEISPDERLGLVAHDFFMFATARSRRIEPA